MLTGQPEDAMPLTAMAFWLVYVLGAAGAILCPLLGVLLYVLVYHLNPESQWWGYSIQAMGLRTSMTIAVAIVIGIVLRPPKRDRTTRNFPTVILMLALFTLWSAASMMWGYGPSERGAAQLEKLIKILIFLVILVHVVRRPAHFHALMIAWMVGILYIGYQAYGNVGIKVHGRLSGGLGGPDFSDSGDLSTHLIASLPLIGALFFCSRTWIGRIFAAATATLAMNTIIMTRNRSAIFGISAALLAGVFSLPRGYRIRASALVIAATFVGFSLTDPGWWDRMHTTANYATDDSAMGRLTYWRAALDMADEYPLGIALGNFHETVMDYVPGLDRIRGAHNTYLECLAELGYPGLAMLLLVIVATMYRITMNMHRAKRMDNFVSLNFGPMSAKFHLGWYLVALRAGLAGYLACALFQTRTAAEDFWMLLTFSAVLDNIARHMIVTQNETEETHLMDPVPAYPPTMNGHPKPAFGRGESCGSAWS